MGIALIIVGGLVLMTVSASVFGFLGEKKKRLDPQLENKIGRIEQRLSILEERLGRDDERFEEIESEVAFVNKLISDKSSSSS